MVKWLSISLINREVIWESHASVPWSGHSTLYVAQANEYICITPFFAGEVEEINYIGVMIGEMYKKKT